MVMKLVVLEFEWKDVINVAYFFKYKTKYSHSLS